MLALAYETLAMSVLAISIATLGMLLTVMFGTRSFVNEEAALSGHTLRLTIYSLVRTVWISTRAVPELIWALLVVFFIQQGLLAGALALGIHNFGILGRLCSEVVEDLDPRQIRALRGAGSGRGQVLFYGVLPQVLPQFLTYILYRWEVVIRTTIVVGFVAAGGLGREFRLAMSFFHWTDITLILVTYFLLVLVVDVISSILRRFAR
jgi:phosphonate transport system permease protein